ncbi:MAG: L-threonylcarbamoyladenylate synthase [Armatimonadota bacterium]
MAIVRTEVIQVDPQEPDPVVIRYAGRVIETGGLVALPTDTVYGLVCDSGSPAAIEAAYRVKGRRRDLPLILLLEDTSQVAQYIERMPELAVRAMQEFWPGPLTVVLRDEGEATRPVRAGRDTVGLRLPAHMVPRLVAAELGAALASTSANRSSHPAALTAQQAVEQLDGLVNMVLDGGPTTLGQESTVVSFAGERPRVLREGAITAARLREVVGKVDS